MNVVENDTTMLANCEEQWETSALWALDVSQDDKVVAVGSEDSFIKIYSLEKLLFSQNNISLGDDEESELHKTVVDLKETPVFSLKFSLRNLLMAVGRLNSGF